MKTIRDILGMILGVFLMIVVVFIAAWPLWLGLIIIGLLYQIATK